jgi:urease accessory protein
LHRSCVIAERGSAPRATIATAAPQRVDGACRVVLDRTPEGTTALRDLYQRAPCRVLFPDSETGEPPQVVLLTTSGGLTGGDRTHVTIRVGPSACATITTQAAERIYRSRDASCHVDARIDLEVGAGAWVEWLAQETILYDGARLRRRFAAEVAVSGRLLALESVVFGRIAMHEQFDGGLLHEAWHIRRASRPVWTDALHLQGDIRRLRAEPFGFGTNAACATLLYVGEDAELQRETVRNMLNARGASGAATVLDGVLITRVLAERAEELRAILMALAAALRHSAGGWPARLPRVWHC